MKNRYSFWMNKLWIVGFMTGCLTLSSCDDEKDLTTGMPENQLINNIVLKVTKQLPVAIGMDTTIVLFRQILRILNCYGLPLMSLLPLLLKMGQSLVRRWEQLSLL